MKDSFHYLFFKWCVPFSTQWRHYGPGSWPRKIWYGIGNLIVYAPVIWQDRDWDHAYFCRLVAFKLRRMQQLELKYGHHLGCERDAKRMGIVAFVLEREASSNFVEWAMLPDAEREYKSLYKFDGGDGRRPLLRDYKRFEKARREAREYAMGILAKHLPGWWD